MAEQSLPLLIVVGLAAVMAGLFLYLSYALGPKKPTDLKATVYECGIPARGSVQIRFFVRFFLVALLFLLFDLEAVFLYPWAILYRQYVENGQALFALGEMGVFLSILVVGFVYVWKKGGLEWQ
ncbi:MAG TPA: NADH-quinone oxidoreductase subunit A [Candidatus Krumholzibacteria bacterium]|nr:NADH-quinone oxidoreductase subunit A [Candidatus Krumholzibacteria bacterium]HRX50395.1 NADH-quinone oxidoreductase subunit A [Candidatus Krumholzibacteria bacterium]